MSGLRRLQINTTGAWRNVVDFDGHAIGVETRIREGAVALALCCTAVKPTLRIVTADGLQRRLATWNFKCGWQEHGSEAQ